MKKNLLAVFATIALFAGFASCAATEEAEDIAPKETVLDTPEYADYTAVYVATDGTRLELTESGDYIATTTTRANTVVFFGKYTIDAKRRIHLTGKLEGSIDTTTGTTQLTMAGQTVTFEKDETGETEKEVSETYSKLCRTWEIEPKAIHNGDHWITITDPAYEQYFGHYGAPKRVIVTARHTFCVECTKESYSGTWSPSSVAGTFYINHAMFKNYVPFKIAEKVSMEFTLEKDGETHTFKVYLKEVSNK